MKCSLNSLSIGRSGLALSLCGFLVFLFSFFASAAPSCRSEFTEKGNLRILLARQEIIRAKYQNLASQRVLKRFDADIDDPSVPASLREVARRLKIEGAKLPTQNSIQYDKFMGRYVAYLQFRFFGSVPLTKSTDEIMASLKKHGPFNEVRDEYQDRGLPVSLMNFPGLTSYEQTSELRANGLSPSGTINKIMPIDGVPGDLSYFRSHDGGHADQWISQLENIQRFYDTDVVGLILESAQYFDHLQAALAKRSDVTFQRRQTLMFLYFFVSHEKNVDIRNSERWLLHVNRFFNRQELAPESQILDQVRNEDLKTIFGPDLVKIVNGAADNTGWPFEPITYDDLLWSLNFIRSIQ